MLSSSIKSASISLAAAALIGGCGSNAMVARTTSVARPVVVYAPTSRGVDESIGLQRDEPLADLLADIDPAHIRHTDSALVSFGTRNTFSDTLSSTHGIGAARRWVHAELASYAAACGGCLKVDDFATVQTIRRAVRGDTVERTANIVDVVATLPGRDTSRVVVLTGHYDSCVCSAGGSFDSTSTAPGADDDGSGTSAIVELARVFSRRFPKGLDATVIFAAVAAEEQGLNGARALAEHLHQAGYTVVAGMTDDIVGNITAEDGTTDSTSMRIFAADPDNSPSRELGRYVWALDRIYLPNFEVLPVWRLDRIGRGGDHEPYVNLGDAGLRFTERVENYNRQHLPTDDFAHVNFNYVANVARVNAVTVGSLAAAPATPANARAARQGRAADDAASTSGGQAWTLSWDPSPGATSYELLVRLTTSATWEQVIPLGNVTRCTLRRQLDDEWAGVRAVSASGARSMVASMPAVRQPTPPGGRGGAARGAAAQAGAGAGAAAGGRAGGRDGQPAGPPPPACGS